MPITITYTNGSNRTAEEIIDKEYKNPFYSDSGPPDFDWTARVGTTYTEIDLIYKNSVYYSISNLSTADLNNFAIEKGAPNATYWPELKSNPDEEEELFARFVWEVDRDLVFTDQDDYILLDADEPDTVGNMKTEVGQILSVNGRGGEDTLHLPHYSSKEIEITRKPDGNFFGVIKSSDYIDKPIELIGIEYLMLKGDEEGRPLNESHPSFINYQVSGDDSVVVDDQASKDDPVGDNDQVSNNSPVNGVYSLDILVDLYGEQLLLKGLTEVVADDKHTLEYNESVFNYDEVDSVIQTVLRDGDFTDEFINEIVDQYPDAVDISYETAVALIGVDNIDAVIRNIAAADGNYIG